jgi:hypothetical protein
MKSHPFRWVSAGFIIGVVIGVAVKVIREELTALAEEDTSPAESQPRPREMQPAA